MAAPGRPTTGAIASIRVRAAAYPQPVYNQLLITTKGAQKKGCW